MHDDLSGETIAGRYRIIEKIGQGGMGAVYKALDTRFQKIVALKVLTSVDADSEQRFLDIRVQAKHLQTFDDPHILQTLDVGKAEGRTYLVLEYVDGRSLAQVMAEGKPFELNYAIEIIRQVGRALEYAHEHNIVHRDVKPSNILVSIDGRAQLSDFGLAIAPGEPTLTEAGTIAGTPIYMSPEQAMGRNLDVRSDLFSLCTVFYEMLTGVRPFSGASSAERLRNVAEASPLSPERLNPAVPGSLAGVVMKALDKEPDRRFPTVTAFLAALEETIVESVAGTNPTPVTKISDARQPDEDLTGTDFVPYEPVRGLAEESKHPSAIAWLLVLDPEVSVDERPRKFRLAGSMTIGRETDNDVVLFDYEVWRHHARISLVNGRFYISDQDSPRGTFVNGVRIEKCELHDRDQIQIGNRTLLFIQAVSPKELNVEAERRLQEFDVVWDQLTVPHAMTDKMQFVAVAKKLVTGLLREAIGYRVESEIPYYQGTVGFMLEAPMLWIRHSRFPILFIAYDGRRSDTLETIVTQLQIGRATEYFALLVVVPAGNETGREADNVRRLVADSVYRYDFVVLDRQALASIVAHNSSRRLVEIILEQGMELSNLSPYVVKGPVPGKMFFGREKEIREVSQGLLSGDFAIVGGRRIGKTSILQRVHRLLNNDPRYQSRYIDCELNFDYKDLLQVFGDEFGEPVSGTNPLGIRKVLGKLKAEAPGRQVVLILDEVDELLAFDAQSKPAGQLFRTFRALSQEGICRFVFSGSRTLYRHLHNPQSPFFNFCEDMTLKPLEQRSVAEIVTKPMHQLGIELPEEEALVDRIIYLSSSHPNIAQWLCDMLIKTATVRRITLDNLDKISADPKFARHYVETAWGDATPLEKLISLMADEPLFELNQLCEKLERHGLTDRNMIREGLEMLQLCSLLDRRGQEYYFALDRFPELVREIEDVEGQIRYLLNQVEA